MFLKTIPADTLGSGMLERAGTLFQMKEKKLDAGWVTDFFLPQLTDCCNRMEQYLAGITVEKANLQQELIQNPAFAAFLAELLSLPPDSNNFYDEIRFSGKSVPGQCAGYYGVSDMRPDGRAGT